MPVHISQHSWGVKPISLTGEKEINMAKIDFGGTIVEEVVTSEEFTLDKAREVSGKDEVIAVLGYGVQGPGQALNMRDNGVQVIVGQREGGKDSWDKAVADGFVPGETLLPIEEAAKKAER